jgi:hypothetical protein
MFEIDEPDLYQRKDNDCSSNSPSKEIRCRTEKAHLVDANMVPDVL